MPVTLPPVHFIWVGKPSAEDKSSHRVAGHDIEKVIEFAKYAKNPIFFYCLQEHEEYYKKIFKDYNVTVRTIENLVHDCCELSELSSLVGEINDYFKTQATVGIRRSSKKWCIREKDLLSLLTTFLYGGFTLDTNVGPLKKIEFSLPDYSSFMLPTINGKQFDVWMFYAPPKNEIVKKSIGTLLEAYHLGSESAILYAISEHLHFSERGENYPWDFKLSGIQVSMEDLNLIKTYYNTHYSDNDRWVTSAVKAIENDAEIMHKKNLTSEDCSLILLEALKSKSIKLIQFLDEKNSEVKPITTILLNELLNKGSNLQFSFSNLLNQLQKKEFSAIFASNNKLEDIAQLIFSWSIEYHAEDYLAISKDSSSFKDLSMLEKKLEAIDVRMNQYIDEDNEKEFDILEKESIPLREEINILKNHKMLFDLCEKNKVLIHEKISQNKNIEPFNTVPKKELDEKTLNRYENETREKTLEKFDLLKKNSFVVSLNKTQQNELPSDAKGLSLNKK